MTESDDSFPWRQASVLAICRLAEPIAFCSINAYAFVMVKEIHGEKDASFYAGLLISAFALAEACTAFLWGSLSDYYGRKPIIMIALAGTALSSLIFGFAKNYWLALFARVIGGALNGNVAVMQTMVAEMVQKPEHEPRAYALQPLMWAVGSVAGSAMGGFTARPAYYHPNLFSENGIFGSFPYLLPNLIAIAMILVAMIQGSILLEETNPRLIDGRADITGSDSEIVHDESTPLIKTFHASVPVSTPEMSPDHAEVFPQSSRKSPVSKGDNSSTIVKQDPIIGANLDRESSTKASPRVFTKEVLMWSIALWLLCYQQMVFGSLLPVFLLDKPRQLPSHLDLVGGLGQDLPTVGSILAASSAISFVQQAFIFPSYVAWVGTWWSFVSMLILYPLTRLIVPFISLLPNPRLSIFISIIPNSMASGTLYPVILILLKNACPSPLVLGKVNGFAMSGSSAARTLSPPVSGAAYSALGSAGAWWSAAAVAFVGVLQLLFITQPQERLKDSEESTIHSSDTV